MVPGLDQLIAGVGAVGRAVAASSTVLPHLAAVIAERVVILHGPDARRPACASAAPRKPAKEARAGRGPMAAVLQSKPGRLLQQLVEF